LVVLQQYIQEVLYRQHTCSVPKIGTFTLQHTPARYDVTDNTIEAPGQKIIFETTWTDDGRCADWIAHKEHLMPSIAQLKMDKYIDELKATLQTGRALVIPGVGTLQANTIGIISFTAEDMPLTRETLHVKPVIRSDASHRITVGNTEMVGQTVTNHLTASADHTSDYNEAVADYPAYPETPSGFRWWWVVAPVGALLFAALVWYLAAKQDENAGKNAAEASMAAVDTMQMKEEIKQVDTLPPAPPIPDTIAYYAVIETFHNKKDAEKKYARRKAWDTTVQLLYTSEDSSLLKIAVPLRSAQADTTRMKDSVSKKFTVKAYLQF
jgi:hypothetical protein